MKKSDMGLSFKAAINGFNKDDVNDYIANMKYDFQRILDEKEDELSIFKNLNAKMTESNNEALEEKERQMAFLSTKISGLTTQLENLEKQYKSDLEKFEIIKMNLEKELNEKSGLNRFEIDQIKNEMVTEIEQLQKEITQNRMELNHMDELYRSLQYEKAILEEDNARLGLENERLEQALRETQEQLCLQQEMSAQPSKPVMVQPIQEQVGYRQDNTEALNLMEAEMHAQKEALVNLLVTAQKQADEMVSAAKLKAESVLEDAKSNAAAIVYDAKCEQIRCEENAKTILEEAKLRAAEEIFRAETIVTNEREKLAAIRKEIKEVREGIIQKLDSYKDGLDQLVVLEADKEKVVIPMRENHG